MNSAQNISIRIANPRDRSAIVQLHKESIQVICAADYSPEQVQALLEHKQTYETYAWGNVVFVAECGETIVGFAALLGSFVSAIYVHPNYIRQGIGKQLLNAVEIEAASRNFRWIFVKASLTGEPFYRACGYEVITRSELVVGSNIKVPCVDMQKRLPIISAAPRDATTTFWEFAQWLLLILLVIYAIAKSTLR